MGAQIRDYSARDREACLRIFESNTPLFFDPSERESLVNWLQAKEEGRIAYSSNLAEHFYVLELEGRVVGCAGFYIPGSGQLANMVWGMVERALHNKGLGRQLLAWRISMVQKDYPHCAIILDTTQHSFGFFERLGFQVTRITPGFYGPGLARYDMVLEPGNNSFAEKYKE